MHAMPVDGDSLCRVCIVNVYNESLLVGDDEGGGRSESVDGIECAERLAIYCLWGRALGAGAAICHWDNLKRKKRVGGRDGGRKGQREEGMEGGRDRGRKGQREEGMEGGRDGGRKGRRVGGREGGMEAVQK